MRDSTMNTWFQTWNRPEYVEWALPRTYGYLLVMARKQTSDWFLAKAKLIFKKSGLPDVKLLQTEIVSTDKETREKVNEWKKVPS
jgi:hypothetical protein